MTSIVPINPKLFEDVKALVVTAKTNVIVHTNYQMTLLYWNMGKRIYEDIMQAERSEYGKTIITSLAKQLSAEFGKGGLVRIFYIKWSVFMRVFLTSQLLRHCRNN